MVLDSKLNAKQKKEKLTSRRRKNKKNKKLKVYIRSNKYPKRSVPRVNYKEEPNYPIDRFVYCDKCMNEYLGKCCKHPLRHIKDEPAPLSPKNISYALRTLPKGVLEINGTDIHAGGLGVFALTFIKIGTKFGPYQGTTEENIKSDGSYSWQIKKNGRIVGHIDGNDTSQANWMRFVNCARNHAEQNLVAYQYRGQIFYRVVRDIQPNTELLVFYGRKFAKDLGIDVKNYFKKS